MDNGVVGGTQWVMVNGERGKKGGEEKERQGREKGLGWVSVVKFVIDQC